MNVVISFGAGKTVSGRPRLLFYHITIFFSFAPSLNGNIADVIQPNLKFNSTKEDCEFLNEGLIMLMCKDWAWKYKCLSLELIMLRDARSFNNDLAFHGVSKDWAWKFKKMRNQT